MNSARARDIEGGHLATKTPDSRQYFTVGIIVLSVLLTLSLCMTMIVYLPPQREASGGLKLDGRGCPEGPTGPLSSHQVREMKNFVRYQWPANYHVEYRCRWLVKEAGDTANARRKRTLEKS